jgi:hypothetical protein
VEVTPILRTLWQSKLMLAATVAAALALSITAGYHVSGFPPKLKSRTVPSGAATAQILVDSPSSALANLKQNPLPLSTRAGVFAQFMASTAIRDAVAKRAGLPASSILAQGPFDDPATAPEGPKPPDPGSVARGKKFRLTFVAQEQLPVVTVYAQAPTVALAQRLADAVAPAVQGYVDQLQVDADLRPEYRTQIRGLGPAQAGTVKGKPSVKVIGTFIFVMLLGCILILTTARRRTRRAPRRGPIAAAAAATPVAAALAPEADDELPSIVRPGGERRGDGGGRDVALYP